MTLEALPEALLMIGSSPELTGRELVAAIEQQIAAHPRTLQVIPGPSELGQPCKRRFVYKLLGHPEQHSDSWLPTIGTAVHAWLEDALAADNEGYMVTAGIERWLLETRVSVGEVDGVEITGSADVYDRITGSVIDWKIVGPSTMRKYKANGPGDQYRKQAHLYGRGFVRAGLPVERVIVAFLPRNAPLSAAYFWHEPYDEQVAIDALEAATGLAIATRLVGYPLLATIPTVDNYCGSCEYFRAGSTDPIKGCSGDVAAAAQQPFADLLGTTQGVTK